MHTSTQLLQRQLHAYADSWQYDSARDVPPWELEGWLEAAPGKGAVVATPPKAKASERQRVLRQEIEWLAVEARRVGLTLAEVTETLTEQWKKLEGGGKTSVA